MPAYKFSLPSIDKHWTVRFSRRLKHWGTCNWSKREIVLNTEARREGIARQVLLHEMLHRLFPWMEEGCVDTAATELDDALDALDGELD